MGTRLYVGNIPYNTSDDELRQLFSQNGRTVTDVKVVTDRETGQSRGFAFVEMQKSEEAQAAITELNGSSMGGRSIVVNEARERTPGGGGGGPSRPPGPPRPGGPPSGPRFAGPGGGGGGGYGGGGYAGGGGYGGGGGGGGGYGPPPAGGGYGGPPGGGNFGGPPRRDFGPPAPAGGAERRPGFPDKNDNRRRRNSDRDRERERLKKADDESDY